MERMTLGVTIFVIVFFNVAVAILRAMNRNGIKTTWSNREQTKRTYTRRERIAGDIATHLAVTVFVITASVLTNTNIWWLGFLSVPALIGTLAGANYVALRLIKDETVEEQPR